MWRSRYSFSALASISRLKKKWGTVVQLCVVRSAMMRPIELWTSMFLDLAADVAAVGADAAACTSEARISPSAPEPRTLAKSTPNSLARRRALGEILALAGGAEAVVLAGVAGREDDPVCACAPALAAGAA